MIYSEKLQKAVQFSSQKHKTQKRKILDYPYITHPLMVMYLVSKFTDNEDILCAAVLHDTVEDTDTTLDEIRENFGDKVHYFVDILSHDNSLKYDEKYKQYFNRILKENNKDIFLIKSADILYNISDTAGSLNKGTTMMDVFPKFERYLETQWGFIDNLNEVWKKNPFLDDLSHYMKKIKQVRNEK